LAHDMLAQPAIGEPFGVRGVAGRSFMMLQAILLLVQMSWHVSAIKTIESTMDSPSYQAAVAPSFISIEPMWWLHIPKSGSSLANTIVHFACGTRVPDNLTLNGGPGPPRFEETFSQCGHGHFQFFRAGHYQLPDDVDLSKVVTMIREPKQRILSGYLHNLHQAGQKLWNKYGISGENQKPRWREGVTPMFDPKIVMEYAPLVAGKETCMLGGGPGCNHGKPSAAEVQLAVDRIQRIGFVGVTNHWDLSICLWHAKFGRECLAVEFATVNGGTLYNGTHAAYDASFFDPSFNLPDNVIYDAALRRFEEDLAKYGVTPHSCATKYCPQVAHIFGTSTEKVDLTTVWWPGRMDFCED